jgi:hypothetical protein
VQPTITADNLVALAGRLEARAKMLGESQPGNAMDLRVRVARPACGESLVFTSVSLMV